MPIVETEDRGAVRHVVLNRPEKRNAFNDELVLGLRDALTAATDDDSVQAAAAWVRGEYGHLDVLINNAGTAAPRLGAEELTAAAAMEGFAINVFGPIRVMHAFLPLLRTAEHPRIVNVSSGVGSFHRILEPGTVENAVALPVYPATKAALTMLTVQYARALPGILVNAADPGFTGSDACRAGDGLDGIVIVGQHADIIFCDDVRAIVDDGVGA